MSTLIHEIDARTGLVGANQMELLLFHLGTTELFGINVFKVREVMHLPPIIRLPESDPRLMGLANVRGTTIPVIALQRSLGLATGRPTPAEHTAPRKPMLIVTHYSDTVQGFCVDGVDRIVRTSWDDVKSPPTLVAEDNHGTITAVTILDDERMVLILDVEKLLVDMGQGQDEAPYHSITSHPSLADKTVLYADDSLVARTHIRKALTKLGVHAVQATTGREAWDYLQASGPEQPRRVHLVLSDIEMPDMDGFTLTKHIRATPHLGTLPIILHSSLTGRCNRDKGQQVGATDYLSKFDPLHLTTTVRRHLDGTS